MLKSVDPLLTGELLAILSDMGHGDEVVITDANFPAASVARRLVRLPGSTATDVLDAVLSVLPLDDFVDRPAAAMDAPGERPVSLPRCAHPPASGSRRAPRRAAPCPPSRTGWWPPSARRRPREARAVAG